MILGLGSDIIDIRRIEKVIEKYGDRFLERIYTPVELAKAMRRTEKIRAATFAKRFAAKEAVGKALGVGVHFTWKEIEISGRPKPSVRLSGRTALAAERLGAARIDVSMTHSRELAAAVAVVVDS